MTNLPQPDAQTITQAVLSIADSHQDLANSYQNLATEAGRLQNVPAFNQIIQILLRLSNDVGRLRNRVRRLQGAQQRYEDLWAFPILAWCRRRTHSLTRQGRLPIMLYNASASQLAPIRYPAGITGGNLPQTQREFATFTSKCSARNW